MRRCSQFAAWRSFLSVGEKRGRGEECISVGGESHWLRIHEGGLLCLVLSIVNDVLPSPLSFSYFIS